MTRYDPHPQAHDDARTFGPVDAERRPHDGMPHRGSCGDCGALLTVPNVVGTTLAAHPADAPAEAPEPSGDVVERATQVLNARTEPLCGECSVPGSSMDTLLCGACDARALVDAGLLADPAETEHRLVCDQCRATKAALRAARRDAERAQAALRQVRRFASSGHSGTGAERLADVRMVVDAALSDEATR